MARAKRAEQEITEEKVINLEEADPPEDGKKIRKTKTKTRKKGRLKLILLLVVIFAVGAFLFALVYFDLFGARTGAYEFLHNLDPEYRVVTLREAELEAREAELEAEQQLLAEAQAEMDSYERELTELEADLKAIETNRLPVYRQPLNDSDIEYMQQIGKIFSGMEAQNAADILQSLYDIGDTAAVLYYMSADSAGSILELMEVGYAAQVTDTLLYN